MAGRGDGGCVCLSARPYLPAGHARGRADAAVLGCLGRSAAQHALDVAGDPIDLQIHPCTGLQRVQGGVLHGAGDGRLSCVIVPAFVTVVTGGANVLLGVLPAAGFLGLIQSGMTAAFGQLAGQIGLLITVIFVIRLLPKGMGHLFTRR